MKKKKKMIILASVLGTLVCLAAIFTAYLAMGRKYREIFFPNTVINGVDCSEMTASEVEQRIQDSIDRYTLELNFRGGETQIITGSDFNYTYVPNGAVQSILSEQNPLLWITETGKDHTYTLENTYTYEEDTLKELLLTFPQLQEKTMSAPADAQVVYQDGSYTVAEASEGTTLDPAAVLTAVQDAVKSGEPRLDLEEKDLYAKPALLSDDPGLAAQAEQLNELANAHITYTLPDGSSAELTPELLKSWLTQNEDGSYARDEAVFEEHLRSFVEELNAKTSFSGEEHLFDTTLDGTISVPYGDLSTYTGYQMDVEGELEALKTQIAEHQVITREPVYLTTGGVSGNHGVGGTYVELNLTRQHLWYYKNGELAFDTNIVSGTMTTWRYTPAGWYTLASKKSPHTMKGEIDPATGKPIYTAKCTYWMPFIPSVGIGFHDYDTGRSDWRTSAYLTNGSHGCINMHLGDARTLYESVEVGTPVIVYYTEPYTLRKELSPAEKFAQNPKPPAATSTPTPPAETPSTPAPSTPTPTPVPPTPTPEPPTPTPVPPTEPPAPPTPEPEGL